MGILKANIPGKYHVDERCIGCAICSAIAPQNFRSDHEQGYDYVYKQPDNEVEESLCAEAMDICPVDAIGATGTGGEYQAGLNDNLEGTAGGSRETGSQHQSGTERQRL